MQLSQNFTYAEAIRSTDGTRLRISNEVPREFIPRLGATALMILQPCRNHYDRPIRPSSWYRCPELNKAVGGVEDSDHVEAEAVDFEVPGIDNLVLAKWIRDNLEFNQLILEHYVSGIPDSGWIHCSYTIQIANRNEVLTILNNGRVIRGLGDEG